MCDPLTIAAISLSTMGAIEGHNAQRDAYKANAKAASQAKVDEDRMINQQEAQIQEQAAQAKIAQDLETQQIASRAQATDSGGFLNNNAVIQDIVRQGLVANNMTSQNLERQQAQLGEERIGAERRAQSRINSVARPSRTATALQIGASAATTAAMAGYGGKKPSTGTTVKASTTTGSQSAGYNAFTQSTPQMSAHNPYANYFK